MKKSFKQLIQVILFSLSFFSATLTVEATKKRKLNDGPVTDESSVLPKPRKTIKVKARSLVEVKNVVSNQEEALREATQYALNIQRLFQQASLDFVFSLFQAALRTTAEDETKLIAAMQERKLVVAQSHDETYQPGLSGIVSNVVNHLSAKSAQEQSIIQDVAKNIIEADAKIAQALHDAKAPKASSLSVEEDEYEYVTRSPQSPDIQYNPHLPRAEDFTNEYALKMASLCQNLQMLFEDAIDEYDESRIKNGMLKQVDRQYKNTPAFKNWYETGADKYTRHVYAIKFAYEATMQEAADLCLRYQTTLPAIQESMIRPSSKSREKSPLIEAIKNFQKHIDTLLHQATQAKKAAEDTKATRLKNRFTKQKEKQLQQERERLQKEFTTKETLLQQQLQQEREHTQAEKIELEKLREAARKNRKKCNCSWRAFSSLFGLTSASE